MKKSIFIAAFLAASALGSNAQEWIDVTSTYVNNPGFDACTPSTTDIAPSAAGFSVDYEAEGWKLTQKSAWCCSGVLAYGSGKNLKGVPVPANDNNGNSGNAMGISIGRLYPILYQTASEITLPKGKYRLSAWCINQNNASANYTSYASKFGFIPNDGTESLSTLNKLTYGVWTEDKVEFTISTTTSGHIQVGGMGVNNNWSTDQHAKIFIDNIKLEFIPFIYAMIEEASALLPTANIGNAPFQRPEAPVEALSQAIDEAQTAYQQFKNGTITDLSTAEANLQNAIDTYNNAKDIVNNPQEGQHFKLTTTFDFAEYKASMAPLTGGTLTMAPNPAQTVPNRYVLIIGTSSTKRYENSEYLAQAFTFTPVTGVDGGFYMSIIDEDGNERFVCDGSKVGGNNLQIRTTTNQTDALVIKVIPTNVEGVFNLCNTANNINLSFTDYGAYCWASMTGKSDGFTITPYDNTVNIPCNLQQGKYATRIFPFAVTDDNTTLTDFFTAQTAVKVYECETIAENGYTLILDEVTDIHANKPYIIEAVENCNFSLQGYGTAYASTYEQGLLVGNYDSEGTVPAGCYVLQTQDESQAFYIVQEGTVINLTPYRAYLKYTPPTGGEAKQFLSIIKNSEETTHINNAETDSERIVEVYSISGIRSHNGMVRGVNIVRMADGSVRKVIVSE